MLRLSPGIALAGLGAAAAAAVAAPWPALSPIVAAVVLGAVAGGVLPRWPSLAPGLTVASRTLLRLAVVLLGLRLVVGDVAAIGARPLAIVGGVAVTTVAVVALLARWLRLDRDLGLLTGTGFAICGASAVAAAQTTLDADEADVTAALALVLLFGTVSVVALPPLSVALGLPPVVAGAWLGASIHDVGQVVAAAEVLGDSTLETAMLVKLTRVLLLGPLLLALALVTGSRRRSGSGRRRVTPLPPFVLGFALLVLVRSSGVVPEAVLSAGQAAERALFALALFAVGTEVRLERLRAAGPRPLLLGGLAWCLITSLGFAASILAFAGAG